MELSKQNGPSGVAAAIKTEGDRVKSAGLTEGKDVDGEPIGSYLPGAPTSSRTRKKPRPAGTRMASPGRQTFSACMPGMDGL